MLEEEAHQGLVRRVVRILYGEGDRFGCWVDVAADAIAWHEVRGGEGAPALQQQDGGSAAEDLHQQVIIGQ